MSEPVWADEERTWMYVRGVTCVACPGCAFTFDAVHEDTAGGYSCPNCGWGVASPAVCCGGCYPDGVTLTACAGCPDVLALPASEGAA